MAVARGGTLVTDLPEDDGEAHPGEHYPVGHRVHLVTCAEGSRAASLFGAELLVNTLHHQAVADPGEGLQVTGRAADGVVEVTEAVDRPVLAVQWHPERLRAPDPTFQWLVAQAGQVAACA
jgi:putative glutamine amidotransferase